MASVSGVLQDKNGNDLYPYTFDQEVLDSNNVPISTRLGTASEASGVSGTSAFAKINTLNSELTNMNEVVSLTANGTETYAQLLTRLFNALDRSKVTVKATLYVTALQCVYHMTNPVSNGYVMGTCAVSSSLPYISCVLLLSNSTSITTYSSNTYTDYSTLTATGRVEFRYQ